MEFSIDTYKEDYLDGMTALFNAETAGEPHIAPLKPARFVELVQRKSYFDPAGLFVAREGGRVLGWIHACVAGGTEPWQDPNKKVGRIRMLIYPAERLKVGAALVSEATAWLRRTGERWFCAIHPKYGYPFYRGLWLGGEPMGASRLPHVQLAFEVGGYKLAQESILMTAEMRERPQELKAQLSAEAEEAPAPMAHEMMRESWIGFEPRNTLLTLEGKKIGWVGWVVEPHVAERLGAPCMNIWSLGVIQEHRRKGLATRLVSLAMSSAWQRGARFCSVGTQLWNAPAHATYAALGYRPYALVIGRVLELTQAQ